MAELTFIDWNTNDILEEMKTEFRTQSGDELEIGSNEMAIAATVSYILGVAKDRFNEMAKQRFLSTATGQYLDAHAENLGIMERPHDYKARCNVLCSNVGQSNITIGPGSLIISDGSGHQFKPLFSCTIEPLNSINVMFESVTSDTKNNNIAEGEIDTVVTTSYLAVLHVTNLTSTSGANPEPFPYTDEGDDAFRKYVKDTFQGTSAGGSAAAYRVIALNADPRVHDAYVKRTGDYGFTSGHIKVFWTSNNPDVINDIDIQTSISETILFKLFGADKRAVNDAIDTPEFAGAARLSSAEYFIYYDDTKYDWAFIRPIVETARNKYCEYLRANLGVPFSSVGLFSWILKEENGDCIKYIAPTQTSPDFINCNKWQVAIDAINISFLDGEGAVG